MQRNKILTFIIGIVLVGGIFAAGIYTGFFLKEKTVTLNQGRIEILNKAAGPTIQRVDFSLFWQTWDVLFDKYLKAKDINPQKMLEGAISGMVQSLGDPYTVFFTPEEYGNFKTQMAGKYQGIGIELGYRDGKVVVVTPFEGSPAIQKGIKAGEMILEVDGKTTDDLNLSEVAALIRGPKDTTVKLSLLRPGENEAYSVEVVRQEITYRSVTYTMEGDIAHIRILQFIDNTNIEWDQTIKEVLKENPEGIVLDLRNNPGGYVNSAVYVAGDFVKNKVVTKERFSDGNVQILESEGLGRLSAYPMVILVNEGTASASEILAGALNFHEKGQLVGKKTFGKGIVQEETTPVNGYVLHVTTAEWLLPNDDTIHQKGLTPEIEIDISQDDVKAGRDPQLIKALELLK